MHWLSKIEPTCRGARTALGVSSGRLLVNAIGSRTCMLLPIAILICYWLWENPLLRSCTMSKVQGYMMQISKLLHKPDMLISAFNVILIWLNRKDQAYQRQHSFKFSDLVQLMPSTFAQHRTSAFWKAILPVTGDGAPPAQKFAQPVF